MPSTTIKLDIALIKVSIVEIVKASPRKITTKDKKAVCSFSNNEKKLRSGLMEGSIEQPVLL